MACLHYSCAAADTNNDFHIPIYLFVCLCGLLLSPFSSCPFFFLSRNNSNTSNLPVSINRWPPFGNSSPSHPTNLVRPTEKWLFSILYVCDYLLIFFRSIFWLPHDPKIYINLAIFSYLVDTGNERRTTNGGSCSTTRHRASITTTPPRNGPCGTGRPIATSFRWPNYRCWSGPLFFCLLLSWKHCFVSFFFFLSFLISPYSQQLENKKKRRRCTMYGMEQPQQQTQRGGGDSLSVPEFLALYFSLKLFFGVLFLFFFPVKREEKWRLRVKRRYGACQSRRKRGQCWNSDTLRTCHGRFQLAKIKGTGRSTAPF